MKTFYFLLLLLVSPFLSQATCGAMGGGFSGGGVELILILGLLLVIGMAMLLVSVWIIALSVKYLTKRLRCW